MKTGRMLTYLIVAVLIGFAHTTLAEAKPIRIGIVTFLSGPGAAAFGVPAHNAAVLLFDALNAGKVPAPYKTRGFGGTPIELVLMESISKGQTR